MNEFARLILLLFFAGLALTVMGALAIRLADEGRQIRRGLKRVLKAAPHAMIVARGRGRGVGFNFNSDTLAVAWDAGAWCLVYRVEELIGAEVIVDGQVAARAYRGEPRRALDILLGADDDVRLRFVFSDPKHPDFDLVLWVPADEASRGGRTAGEALHEANSWIARTEALFRRPTAPKPLPAALAEPVRPYPPSPPEPRLFAEEELEEDEEEEEEDEEEDAEEENADEDDDDEAPPWDDDEEDVEEETEDEDEDAIP